MSLSSIIVATNAVLLKRVDSAMGSEQDQGAGPASMLQAQTAG